jgi:N6-L-threonylcarbamoyladenine synthase
MTEGLTGTTLAIESSCDETCAAVVRDGKLVSNIVASQADLHQRFGGVVPEIASRRHLELVDAVIAQALEDAGVDRPDRIAVTRGPGLIGALLVGLAAAKARAYVWDVPLVAVDHLAGHVASVLLAEPRPQLPMLCLVVSGGHTLVLDVDESLGLTLLGTTRDDAAGEAFDKGARLLGLGMPGGPAIEKLAARGDDRAIAFTPAMVHHDTLDLSFAGLKTALANAVRERTGDAVPEGQVAADLAASYQRAVVATIMGCVRKLLRQRGPGSGHPDERTRIGLVGGVAANGLLRAELTRICEETGVEVVLAPLRFCADNAAMIGMAAPYCAVADASALRVLDAYATSPLFRQSNLLPMELL